LIGIDIVSHKRIEKVYNKFKYRFLEKIYTENEIEYCLNKKFFVECLSARFAAKEACIKAIYQYCSVRLEMKQIEICGKRNEGAAIKIHSDKLEFTKLQILLSISHEKDYSVAVILINKDSL
jgi:holo-[acyl-carrier protein] synthase